MRRQTDPEELLLLPELLDDELPEEELLEELECAEEPGAGDLLARAMYTVDDQRTACAANQLDLYEASMLQISVASPV